MELDWHNTDNASLSLFPSYLSPKNNWNVGKWLHLSKYLWEPAHLSHLRWDKLIAFKTRNCVSEDVDGCIKCVFLLCWEEKMVLLIGHVQTWTINLVFLVKLCHLLWNPESVTCCDSGTASPLHQCLVRRWHMMDFRTVLFPSPDCRDCLGMLAGPWQAEPPLCFTLINIQLCPQNPSWAVTTHPIFLYHGGWCSCCC